MTISPSPLLIFDLDGTLVHSLPGIAASVNHALATFGFPRHSEQAVCGFVGDGARLLIRRALPAGADDSTVSRTFAAFNEHYASHWSAGVHLFDGVREMLDRLAGLQLPMAVLSNKPHAFTLEMVETLIPGHPFSIVLGQRDSIPHKPDPAGVREILAQTGKQTADAWMIGDSDTDLATARNAGLRAIAVTWGYRDRSLLAAGNPDHLIDSPGEIVSLASAARTSSQTP